VERLTTTEEVLRIDKGGSRGWTRTNDPAVNSRLLYQLSYSGILKPGSRMTVRNSVYIMT
jgi:hypothetical protein